MVNESRICNCIALHDFKLEGIKWKEWFDYCLEFFTKHSLEPMRLAVGGIHYGYSVKTMTFKGGRKKLGKFNFEGIHRLGFMVMEDKNDYTTNFIIDVCIFPDLDNPYESKLKFCIDEKLEPFNQTHFENIAFNLYDFTKAKLGYYYNRSLKNEPDSFVGGGNIHFVNEEEKRRCRLWKNAIVYDETYKTGDLRDIFGLNFLSREHLIRDVGSTDQHETGAPITLEAWINSNPAHGKLNQLREDFWSWYVPDEHIESVRNALIPSGIILCV